MAEVDNQQKRRSSRFFGAWYLCIGAGFGLLGLRAHALEHILEIQHPMLPDSVTYLDLDGLRVGPYSVNIRFGRDRDGHTVVEAVQADPGLRVKIQ